ncbi:MAG: hypothetical protein SF069_18130 [Phycisphaerae bacterium]|nr:hypothetical protein [Phycisphaerae bacterium]
MSSRMCTTLIRLCAIGGLSAVSAFGEVTAIRGTVDAIVQEIIGLSAGAREEVSDAFPETSADLPIVAIAELDSNDENAAAIAAAQFQDPTLSAIQNPEEFAISMALFSESEGRSYQGRATGSEIRTVVFRPEEFFGTEAGDQVDVRGRIFIDGALAIFSQEDLTDLSDANVRLRVRVEQSGSLGGTVFDGSIDLVGAQDGQAGATRSGDLPDRAITIVDLGELNPDFGHLWVVVILPTQVDYDYSAIIGEEFTLTATFEVEAQNAPEGVGCAAIIGTPFETLTQVIDLTQSEAAANRLTTSIRNERDRPSGTRLNGQPINGLGLCPLTGLAMVGLSVVGLMYRRTR